ncbi:hypothetical protein MKW94_019308 [Papaver nudicaule]|uniref:Uncharacterized protein n=1 Tax=Papaver nudicaule TaxID=74823 RepID=A0AA41RTY0_PAPNU|nr:hypothetical protein [Papaver nudicaule]
MNRGTGPPTANMIRIPDAMSEKVCYQHRWSERLRNKDYVFTEESMCASTSGFAPSLDEFGGNKESSNSGPSDEIPGAESESAEDVSSGGTPSSCREVYAEQVPLSREAIRGNDFSNTIFVDDNPPSHSQPACDSGGGTVQSDLPSESLPGPQAPPDFGLLGAGLDSRWGENENARVRRPSSVPHPGVDTRFHVPASRVLSSPLNESDYRRLLGAMTENCNQLQNSLARLNNISSFASGSDVSVRCEVGELKAANAKLSTSLTSMAEELDAMKGTLKSVCSELQLVCEDKAKTERLLHTQTLELSRLNQELINSRARESKLQSSLDEVEKAIGKAPRR